MKQKHILPAVLLSLTPLVAACADAPEVGTAEDEIVNGFADSGDPTVLKLYALDTAYPGGPAAEWCTGTLIATKTVLTAAHCARDSANVPYASLTVSGTELEYDYELHRWHGPFPFSMQTAAISRHPTLDLAVLTLPEPVTGWTPSALSSSMWAGMPIRLVGFGATSGSPPYPNYGGNKYYGSNTIDSFDSNGIYFDADAGDAWTCYGDSGGPAFRSGTSCVVGVTKSGPSNCGTTGTYTDTRVDTAAAWVHGQTSQTIANCTP